MAKAVKKTLGYLGVDRIEIYPDKEDGVGMYVDLVLEQINVNYLSEKADKFDEQYLKK